MKSALKLIAHVWTEQKTTAWEALNHCMFDAVKLAIGAKLEWEPADFTHIEKNFRPGYWLGVDGWENAYALAVWTDGTSFIKAFESRSGRKPFIANCVSAHGQAKGYAHANSQDCQRGRIALNSEVWIDRLRYNCTSITNERIVLTSRNETGKRTIKKLTHEDCAALWPAPKKPKKPAKSEEAPAQS